MRTLCRTRCIDVFDQLPLTLIPILSITLQRIPCYGETSYMQTFTAMGSLTCSMVFYSIIFRVGSIPQVFVGLLFGGRNCSLPRLLHPSKGAVIFCGFQCTPGNQHHAKKNIVQKETPFCKFVLSIIFFGGGGYLKRLVLCVGRHMFL